MITVGLTGGIATGKSTAAALLRSELGVPVLDADQLAREVVAPGTEGLAQVAARFGPAVLQPDGALDRKALGAVVMADAAARRDLEAITHPLIRERIARGLMGLARAGHHVAAVEAALLVETGSHAHYDRLLVITCPPALQRARLMEREGFSEAQARAWIDAQLPLARKEALADAVVVNDGSKALLAARLRAAWGGMGLPVPGQGRAPSA